jgi:hypothetical protein
MVSLGMIYLNGIGTIIPSNVEKAASYFHQAAERGVVDAMVNLGTLYRDGKHPFPSNVNKAIEYFENAARQGNLLSIVCLSEIYLNGETDKGIDMEQAVYWLIRAAKKGHAESAYMLGSIYAEGLGGLTVHKKLAFHYFRLAANHDHPIASLNVGLSYCDGLFDQTIDITSAIQYLSKAAQLGNAHAHYKLGDIYYSIFENDTNDYVAFSNAIDHYESAAKGDVIEAMIKLGTILLARDINRAIENLQLAAKRGNVESLLQLGFIYRNGYGHIAANHALALEYFIQASELDNSHAKFQVGCLLYKGSTNIVDFKEAIHFWQHAAVQGEINAHFNLGNIFLHGLHGVDKHVSKALHHFDCAGNGGNSGALVILGWLYLNGIPGELVADTKMAVKYLEKGAALGHPVAMALLGVTFLNGKGTIDNNIEQAVMYLEKAASAGNIAATNQLGRLYLDEDKSTVLDSTNTLQLLQRVAQAGCGEALCLLGYIYEEGKGSIKRNETQAWFYYQQAVEYNCVPAIIKLADRLRDTADLEGALRLYIRGCEVKLETLPRDSHFAFVQYCRFQSGTILQALQRVSEAAAAFNICIQDGYYLGYVGLASLQKDMELKLQLLIKAANHGVAEAWFELRAFVDDPLLHTLWSVENLGTLRSISVTDNAIVIPRVSLFTYLPYCSGCKFCEEIKMRTIDTGPNNEQYELPSLHLVNDPFKASSSLTISESKGGHGTVVIKEVETNEGTRIIVAMKKATERYISQLTSEHTFLRLMQGSSHIVQTYGHIVDDDDIYIIMEGARYGSLQNALHQTSMQMLFDSNNGPRLMLQWMYEIVSGLAYMHRFNVRHQDMKPLNVLLFDGLHVKLADLGLSKRSTLSYPCTTLSCRLCDADDAQGSGSSMNGGTPGFMAPDNNASLAIDMFSFGVTCLHIILRLKFNKIVVTGAFDDRNKVLLLHSTTWWKERCPEGGAVIALIERCLSHSPEERPTAQECVETFEKVMETMKFTLQEKAEIESIFSSSL